MLLPWQLCTEMCRRQSKYYCGTPSRHSRPSNHKELHLFYCSRAARERIQGLPSLGEKWNDFISFSVIIIFGRKEGSVRWISSIFMLSGLAKAGDTDLLLCMLCEQSLRSPRMSRTSYLFTLKQSRYRPGVAQWIPGSKGSQWTGHVARMGEGRGVHKILVGKPEGRRPLGRPRRRWEDNIKRDLREVGGGCGYWTERAQDRDSWRTLVNTVMNFRVT
jgi:hypothetical protein